MDDKLFLLLVFISMDHFFNFAVKQTDRQTRNAKLHLWRWRSKFFFCKRNTRATKHVNGVMRLIQAISDWQSMHTQKSTSELTSTVIGRSIRIHYRRGLFKIEAMEIVMPTDKTTPRKMNWRGDGFFFFIALGHNTRRGIGPRVLRHSVLQTSGSKKTEVPTFYSLSNNVHGHDGVHLFI